ncbi:MAG: hypothetical protein VB119_10855 [Candidatus Metalachnospira sp.]|nr:hypothetical protein [Candidatus Metalachnospira sp.]
MNKAEYQPKYKMVFIAPKSHTASYSINTENTKLSEQLQLTGKLGVYLVLEWVKREDTSLNDTQFGTPRNRMKWAFFNDMIPYE